MSITDIVACQLAKGMPEVMKYNVKKDYKTTPDSFRTKVQNVTPKLNNLDWTTGL